jgi:putative ABC transport system permease protein
MLKDYFKLAWENITHRKIRSWLTIIGIVIGIAAVVALISLGQGVKKVITNEFEKIGTDKIFVMPGSGFNPDTKGISPLTEYDMNIIRRTKGVNEVAGMYYKAGRVLYDKELYIVTIIGMPLDETTKLLDEAWNLEYIDGRPLKSGDKYQIVIGHDVAHGKILGKNVNIGDKIEIEGQKFAVVGEIKAMGDPSVDSGIIMPQKISWEIFNATTSSGGEEAEIIVRVETSENPDAVAENIKRELRRSRGQKEGEEDFSVQTTEQLMESFDIILSALTAIVIGIAAISLFVGGVGIMNTMYTSVLQRTNEIGVMKAIGARNSHILTIFLIESGMLGLIGGVIGLLIGMGLSSLIAFIGRNFLNTMLLYAYFPVYLIVGALLFAFVVGCASGILPAIQASKQNPVDALRYE